MPRILLRNGQEEEKSDVARIYQDLKTVADYGPKGRLELLMLHFWTKGVLTVRGLRAIYQDENSYLRKHDLINEAGEVAPTVKNVLLSSYKVYKAPESPLLIDPKASGKLSVRVAEREFILSTIIGRAI